MRRQFRRRVEHPFFPQSRFDLRAEFLFACAPEFRLMFLFQLGRASSPLICCFGPTPALRIEQPGKCRLLPV
jgi:hypothetical protein